MSLVSYEDLQKEVQRIIQQIEKEQTQGLDTSDLREEVQLLQNDLVAANLLGDVDASN